MALVWQAAVWCVLGTTGGETVLLDFYADWCGPCRAMAPLLEQLARRGYPIRKINIDQHPDLAARFGVRAVPCFVMLVNGREVGREVGQISLARLEQLCLLGRANPPAPGAFGNPEAGGVLAGGPGRQTPPETPASGIASGAGLSEPPPSGPARTPMTKDGLPIPVVHLGTPREPGGQAAAGNLLAGDGQGNPSGSNPSAVWPGGWGNGSFASGQSRPADGNHPSSRPDSASGSLGSAGERASGIGRQQGLAGEPSGLIRSAGAEAGPTGPQLPATSPAPTTPGDRLPTATVSEQDLLASTVRIRVYHGGSLSHGSGTIIDARQGEALILTCGHLFRESQGAGQIEVDLFGPSPAQKVPGRLIAWNEERDLGLLSIRTPGPVRAARVAPVGYPLKKGLLVFSVGCDHGQLPTVRKTWIVSINRYLGAPNLQVADQPVSGRSGGGLFTQEGYLIGVCNAADPADREGLFSALPAIHAQLDEARLQFVYQQTPDVPGQMPGPNPATLAQHSLPSSPSGVSGAVQGDRNLPAPGESVGTDLAALPPGPGRSALPGAPSGTRVPSGRSGPGDSETFGPRESSEAIGPTAGISTAPGPSENRLSAPSGGGPLMELAALLRDGTGSPSAGAASLAGPNRAELTDRHAPSQPRPVESPTKPGGSADRNMASVESGSAGGLRAEESALLAELARRRRQGAEVIFIVRPTDDPHASSEIFVLHDASPELLARLGATGKTPAIRETSLVVGPQPKAPAFLEGPNGGSDGPGAPPPAPVQP
jgi:thiol-disulfide isomerase/thioredoxin